MALTKQITFEYEGITITYIEDTDKWNFELRGRERNADTLKGAKEIIDKPDPVKKKTFARIPGYRVSSRIWDKTAKNFTKVEVTSVADKTYGHPEVWVTEEDKSRSKIRMEHVFVDTEKNRVSMKEYDLLYAHREAT